VKDWSYVKDYLDGMWKMLQQDYPDDFVLGTNELHTVREFAEAALRTIGKTVSWKGRGVNEVGLSKDGETLVKVSREFFRPLESNNYRGDYSKARKKIGWEPGTKFDDLVKIMVESDLKSRI
jgi:GDPmannose 4,6-dehydratase